MTLAGAEWVPAPSGGLGWAVDTADKLLLHTTEGATIEGAIAAYRSHGAWPHLTVDPLTRRIVEHIDYNRAAGALYNGPDPMEPNRSSAVIQVEIVGRAANTHTYSDDWYRWLAVYVIRPLAQMLGIPKRCTRFYGAMHGTIAIETWPGRLWGQRWVTYAGILGHQNVGDGNDHWDPGFLNAEKLLTYAFGYGEVWDPITGALTPVGDFGGALIPDPSTSGDDDLTPLQSQAFDIMVGVLTPTYPPYGRPASLADILDVSLKNHAASTGVLQQIAASLRSIDEKLSQPAAAVDTDELVAKLLAALGEKLS